MKDIDQQAKEQLPQYEVAPPPMVWDTLSDVLQQKRRRRRAGYWAVAAVLLVVGMLGVIALRWQPEKRSVITIQGKPALTPRLPASDEPTQADRLADLPDPNAVSTPLSALPPRTAPAEPKKASGYGEPKEALGRVEDLPVVVPPVLAEAAKTKVVSVAEKKSDQPTLVVEASRYRKRDTTAAQVAERAQPAEITVIYQPNPSALARKKSLGQQIGKTLTFIQDNGISFSELRSAKSALVDKLFSKEEPSRPKRSDSP